MIMAEFNAQGGREESAVAAGQAGQQLAEPEAPAAAEPTTMPAMPIPDTQMAPEPPAAEAMPEPSLVEQTTPEMSVAAPSATAEAPVVPVVAPTVVPVTTPPVEPYSAEIKQDISSNKIFSILAYLSLLCLLVLAFKSKSRFAAFHARQGLLIMIVQFFSLYSITMGTIGFLVVGMTFGFSLVGALEVLQGNYWEFPFLGKLAQKLTFL